MSNPIELITGPLSIYWAPVGEAFPDVDNAPAGNWVLIGTSGDQNYHEDGVSITVTDEKTLFTPLGSALPTAVFRTAQSIVVGVTLVDLTFANLRLAWNLLSVVADAGPPVTSALSLDFTLTVNDLALLARGASKSPELTGGNLQLECNRVVEMAAHALSFVKGDPVGVELEFTVLRDTSGNVGDLKTASV